MKRRSLKLFLLLSCVTLLTSCDTVGDEIGSTIKDNLFPNIWATLAQIVATVLLFGAIFIFAYKPAKKYLNKRGYTNENQRFIRSGTPCFLLRGFSAQENGTRGQHL